MNSTASDGLALVGRILACIIFIVGGWTKLMAAAGTKAYFMRIGVPLPNLAYWVAVLIELGGGVMLLLGLQGRIGGCATALT